MTLFKMASKWLGWDEGIKQLMMKANEKKYNFQMTETTFQHVSVSQVSCTSCIDRSFLPMAPLMAWALPMVPLVLPNSTIGAIGCRYCSGFYYHECYQCRQWRTNGNITNGTIGRIPNVAHIIAVRCRLPGLVIDRTKKSPYSLVSQRPWS